MHCCQRSRSSRSHSAVKRQRNKDPAYMHGCIMQDNHKSTTTSIDLNELLRRGVPRDTTPSLGMILMVFSYSGQVAGQTWLLYARESVEVEVGSLIMYYWWRGARQRAENEHVAPGRLMRSRSWRLESCFPAKIQRKKWEAGVDPASQWALEWSSNLTDLAYSYG